MGNLRNVQTAVRFAVCIALTAFHTFTVLTVLTGCAADGGAGFGGAGGLTGYASADVSYTAEFAEGLCGECERSGGTTVMRMTSPGRLDGLTVTYDGTAGTCAVAVGETAVLLSPETAAGLTDVFDLLARAASDGGVPSKSADGTQTVVRFADADGSVTVGADGVPVEVRLGERAVKIGGFTIQ